MFRWLPSVFPWAGNRIKHQNQGVLRLTLQPRLSHQLDLSIFISKICNLVAVASLWVTTRSFLWTSFKSSPGQAFLRRNRFRLQPPLCGNTSVCVSRCVTCTYTLPFLSASCMTTPQSQPRRRKRKGKPTLGKSASVSSQGPSGLHSEARKHFHTAVATQKVKCFVCILEEIKFRDTVW